MGMHHSLSVLFGWFAQVLAFINEADLYILKPFFGEHIYISLNKYLGVKLVRHKECVYLN